MEARSDLYDTHLGGKSENIPPKREHDGSRCTANTVAPLLAPRHSDPKPLIEHTTGPICKTRPQQMT